MDTVETFDRVLDALGHRYRRRLLVALADHNPQDDDDAQEAAEALGAVIDGEAEQSAVEAALFHNHLPKLEESGYIERNEAEGTISKGPNWDEIAPVIQLLIEYDNDLPAGWL